MLIQAQSMLRRMLSTMTGVAQTRRLTPLALTAVSSLSAPSLPKTRMVAVSIPSGRANTSTNGINRATACRTTATVAWPLMSRVTISFRTFARRRTNVNTATVKTSEARIWRSR